MTLLKKYINEKIGSHWDVNNDKNSFNKLLNHITSSTNLKSFFESEISDPSLITVPEGLIVADMGAGNGWTSALLALKPEIKKVYAIEPSKKRRECIKYVASHFNVPNNKIEIIDGTFNNFKLPEKVHIFCMSSSFHHCFDEEMSTLFDNIKKNVITKFDYSYYNYQNKLVNLSVKGKILLASEHHVSILFNIKHRIKYYLNILNYFLNKNKYNADLKYTKFNTNTGDHYRTKNEIVKIFNSFGLSYNFFYHKGNILIKTQQNKKKFFIKYYYAILEYK